MNRRRFLEAGIGGLAAAAMARAADLPPAIAALKDRRNEVRPITAGERKQRIERARELMQAGRLDAIVLSGGKSMQYFTGVRWGVSERLFLAVIPRQGPVFWVAPKFEEDRAREVNPDRDPRIYTWQEDEDPYALTGQALADAGISTGRVGVEERTVYVFSDNLRRSNNALEMTSATAVTAGCRARKSAAELALLKLANEVTLAAYAAGWQSVKEGMTNHELTALIETGFSRQGFAGEVSVQTNEFSAMPHGSARAQGIREGAVVMMDDGATVEGYSADVTRTVVYGKIPAKVRRVFGIVMEAQDAALAAAKPGVTCESVDRAARKVIEDGGYGPGYKYFTHRLGHGIGLDGHEWPYLVKGNMQKIESGMTFSDEPGIYIPGEFGVRLEDCMYIGAKAAETFTPRCRSIDQPFAL